ncbi:zinc-binding alcohol dehydrogenase family protein [Nostocoides sp. F2B08]|uniref:zinc-dependent alcohol dehydrogenase family protein n=1 Tax=Nostocoides sp. F2B08 TaxID=2653936 RepID=UPI001262E7C3|nr:zinc-dependent alcohol dehydrogenase family protein [Tetrasphaera sp. F2B08]KAB7746030.1 zinc-binding alcohol dehydrogenase family protein [Tetrasphaera sp. F2B08]
MNAARTMQAWVATGHGGGRGRIRAVERPIPRTRSGEVLVRVEACGVCRTDLHVTDGDLPTHRKQVVPGHEVVGRVVETNGPGRFDVGDRVGVAWLRGTCGECRWCREGAENLCDGAVFTGWDEDGGYAELVTAPAAFAYSVPESLPVEQAAPLLCAGIIGYRALSRTRLPPGGRLGIYGFGASAHLTAQIALARGAEVHVLTRGERARDLARELGAASAGEAYAAPPVALDAAIVFAPAGELVPVALEALERGGTLVTAGIHMSEIPPLDYGRHLFLEKHLTSVTANTRADGARLLTLADRLGIRAHVTCYPFAEADRALDDLSDGRVTGVAVLKD